MVDENFINETLPGPLRFSIKLCGALRKGLFEKAWKAPNFGRGCLHRPVRPKRRKGLLKELWISKSSCVVVQINLWFGMILDHFGAVPSGGGSLKGNSKIVIRRGLLKEDANSAWGALAAKTSKCFQNGRCRTRFHEQKNSKPKHGFGGCKVLPKATVPSEGSLKGNCMHEATMPSELVVERKCYA